MKYRLIKRANLEVSEIAFGCMSLGEDHEENARLIHHAIGAGINYFDTADLYQKGFNEETVGNALLGKRQEVLLATKVGNEWNADGEGWRWNPSKNYILKAVEGSLKRLRTDYIDLYQLHGGTIDDPIDEVIEAFEKLKEDGKIRHYGLSSIRPTVVAEYISRSAAVSDMLQYSLFDRRPEEQLLSLLGDAGAGVMVRGGLAKGLLAGKDISDYLNNSSKSVELLIDKLVSFSNEKIGLSHLSIQWLLANSLVSSVVIGIRKMEQLEDVLRLTQFEEMSVSIRDQLSFVLKPNIYKEHRL